MSKPHASTEEVVRQTLDIVPFLMQVMSSEMRSTGHIVVGGHLRLLAELTVGPFTLTDLAEINMVTPPTMSNTISAMEAKGWVRRSRSESDRRLVMIELTDDGRKVHEEIDGATRKRLITLLEPLSDENKTKLVEALEILRQQFEAGVQLGRHHHKG